MRVRGREREGEKERERERESRRGQDKERGREGEGERVGWTHQVGAILEGILKNLSAHKSLVESKKSVQKAELSMLHVRGNMVSDCTRRASYDVHYRPYETLRSVCLAHVHKCT